MNLNRINLCRSLACGIMWLSIRRNRDIAKALPSGLVDHVETGHWSGITPYGKPNARLAAEGDDSLVQTSNSRMAPARRRPPRTLKTALAD